MLTKGINQHLAHICASSTCHPQATTSQSRQRLLQRSPLSSLATIYMQLLILSTICCWKAANLHCSCLVCGANLMSFCMHQNEVLDTQKFVNQCFIISPFGDYMNVICACGEYFIHLLHLHSIMLTGLYVCGLQ
jgi:hypothetical protein